MFLKSQDINKKVLQIIAHLLTIHLTPCSWRVLETEKVLDKNAYCNPDPMEGRKEGREERMDGERPEDGANFCTEAQRSQHHVCSAQDASLLTG